MTTVAQSIGPTMIGKMLRLRHRQTLAVCEEESVALAVHGLASPEETTAAVRHLETCPLCRESVLILGALDAAGVPRRRPASSLIRPRRWQRMAFAVAAAVLIGIAAVLTLVLERDRTPLTGEGLAIKGAADRLQIAVLRDTRRFTLRPMDRLQEHDRLGLFYSAESDGYLAVFVIDNDQAVAPLYPSRSRSSVAIRSGTEVPLPDGAVVRSGSGCEWVVAVFSDHPLDMSSISESLRRADRLAGACELRLDLPQARSIVVLPFRR